VQLDSTLGERKLLHGERSRLTHDDGGRTAVRCPPSTTWSLLWFPRRHYDCVVDVRSKEMSNFDCLREARLKRRLHSPRRTAGIGEITPSS
jgi:hypothetical protein